jgi:hypothetical protein
MCSQIAGGLVLASTPSVYCCGGLEETVVCHGEFTSAGTAQQSDGSPLRSEMTGRLRGKTISGDSAAKLSNNPAIPHLQKRRT